MMAHEDPVAEEEEEFKLKLLSLVNRKIEIMHCNLNEKQANYSNLLWSVLASEN